MWILLHGDRGLGKCVDPLSRRHRKGQMIESFVLKTEDWENVWILCHGDRGLGKCEDPLSCRQSIGEMIEFSVKRTEE